MNYFTDFNEIIAIEYFKSLTVFKNCGGSLEPLIAHWN